MLLKYPAHNSLPLDPGSLMFSQNGLMSLVSYFIICVCVSENLHSLSIRLWKHFFVAAYSLNKQKTETETGHCLNLFPKWSNLIIDLRIFTLGTKPRCPLLEVSLHGRCLLKYHNRWCKCMAKSPFIIKTKYKSSVPPDWAHFYEVSSRNYEELFEWDVRKAPGKTVLVPFRVAINKTTVGHVSLVDWVTYRFLILYPIPN